MQSTVHSAGHLFLRCIPLACVLSCVQLCNTMDCNPPGFSVHEVFQAKVLWNELPFPSHPPPQEVDLPDPGIELMSLTSPALAVSSLPLAPLGKGTFKAPKILSGSYMCV